MLSYTHNIEQAAENTRLALPLMSKYKIPTDPVNYAVWYEYVSGRNNDLKQALDDLLDKGNGIEPELSEMLFKRFLAPTDAGELEQIREGLRGVLAEVLLHVVEAGGETTRYTEILQKYSGRLVPNMTRDKLREMVISIVKDTETIKASEKKLESRLNAGAQEVERLRKELERAREEAVVDALTGLANRRVYEQELQRAVADGLEVCVLFIDVDHFKRYNETHGHLVGDEILRFVARNLKDCVKGKDIVCRYDSDEFVALLPNTPLLGAVACANNILTTVNTQSLRRKSTRDRIGPVTMSIGAAQYRSTESSADFTKRAAQALLKAKATGRNKVVAE